LFCLSIRKSTQVLNFVIEIRANRLMLYLTKSLEPCRVAQIKTKTSDIVAKLWKECRTLQSAGVSYHNYVTELTFLLFLKMMQETKQEKRLPNRHRWSELANREGPSQLDYYRTMLIDLGNPKKKNDPVVLAIFHGAQTHIRLPKDLKALTTAIDRLDWFSARKDGLGDLYEGLGNRICV